MERSDADIIVELQQDVLNYSKAMMDEERRANAAQREIEALKTTLTALQGLVRALDEMTPNRPKAITWENGVKIINHVQDVLLPAYRATLDATTEEGGESE